MPELDATGFEQLQKEGLNTFVVVSADIQPIAQESGYALARWRSAKASQSARNPGNPTNNTESYYERACPALPDQTDALQEVTNIAMGQAGSSLANILGVFVNLSVYAFVVARCCCHRCGNIRHGWPGQGNYRGTPVVSRHHARRRRWLFTMGGCMDLADLIFTNRRRTQA